MHITLTLPPDLEARLQAHLATQDESGVRSVLAEAIEPVVEALLHPDPATLDPATFERLLDELADDFEKQAGQNAPVLSDDALRRASIYEDHP